MIKEIALPHDPEVGCRIMLPLSDDGQHVLLGRERNQCMDVIGHQEDEMCPPIVLLIAKRNRVEQLLGDRLVAELIASSRLTANREEVNGVAGA